MATFLSRTQSLAAGAARVERLSQKLARLDRRQLELAATRARTDMRVPLRAATGGDLRLSHVRKGGAPVNVRWDLGPATNGFTLTGTGAVKLVELPIPGHDIRPKRKRRKGNPRAAMGGGLKHPTQVVHHPGRRRGGQAWTNGVRLVVPRVPKYVSAAITDALRDVYH